MNDTWLVELTIQLITIGFLIWVGYKMSVWFVNKYMGGKTLIQILLEKKEEGE